MGENLQDKLTASEFYYLIYGIESLEDCIKTLFAEALIKKAISVNELETTDNDKSFFVKRDRVVSEFILNNFLDIVFNLKDTISLQEFATNCTNFLNYKFRMSNPDYRIDKKLNQSLLEKGFFIKQNIFLFKRLRKKAKALKVISDIDRVKLNPFHFAEVKNGLNQNDLFKLYRNEISDFERYMEDALNRRVITVAPIVELGRRYPVIKE